ncbi:glycine zipper 2TM domain-containing protein [Brackiella oedipodis]|uniref:glycine zipper 2TM domain-containing protein n=1 Tax=Brackiella oedipodis TaxID=124225 RepID=UPI0004914EC5|nr:glycine zipper 2TM domain-containing protein [Brackiella oedipodis]
MKKFAQIFAILALVLSVAACGLDRRGQYTVGGAAIGGAAGAALSDGSGLGTAGGAIAGGLLGNQLGK